VCSLSQWPYVLAKTVRGQLALRDLIHANCGREDALDNERAADQPASHLWPRTRPRQGPRGLNEVVDPGEYANVRGDHLERPAFVAGNRPAR